MMTNDFAPEKLPDAVRSPLRFAGSGDAASRLATIIAEFSGVLRSPQLFVRHQGSEHFITASPADTLNYPSDGPKSGEPRYDWSDRGDGVLYGYLKTDAQVERTSKEEAGR
jgi:hypothetical protein